MVLPDSISLTFRGRSERENQSRASVTCCEGTTELFKVDYFGETAYLSQSAQLYSEAGIAALEKVYSFGPCFRAEKSNTRRHLTEFWGVEPEMAWVEAEENMHIQERLIHAVLAQVAHERTEDLQFLGRSPEDLLFPAEGFPILTYDEVVERLAAKGRTLSWGRDLSVEDEEALSSDCLMHGGFGEIITGGQRASDHDFLLQRIREYGLKEEDLDWYLDLREFGPVPHAGFGMGIERMLRWLCGLHHIRECIPFARTPERSRP